MKKKKKKKKGETIRVDLAERLHDLGERMRPPDKLRRKLAALSISMSEATRVDIPADSPEAERITERRAEAAAARQHEEFIERRDELTAKGYEWVCTKRQADYLLSRGFDPALPRNTLTKILKRKGAIYSPKPRGWFYPPGFKA